MSGTGVSSALVSLLKNAAGTACGCGARAWGAAVERNLGGVIVRAEVRTR